jgi:DnaJ-class molecular chaperone
MRGDKNWRVCDDCQGAGHSIDYTKGCMSWTACKTCAGLGGWDNRKGERKHFQLKQKKGDSYV